MHETKLFSISNSFSAFQQLVQICLTYKINLEKKKQLISDFIDQYKHQYPFTMGNNVYFMYVGKGNNVHIAGDFNEWKPSDKDQKLIRLDKTNLFYLKKSFPLDARLDYQIIVDGRWMLDPLNESKLLGGFGFNSELKMPGYTNNNDITAEEINIPQGSMIDIDFLSEIQKNWTRKISIYLPASYGENEDKKYPSLYAVDRNDYLTAGNVKDILDKLIYEKQIPELIGVFIDPLSSELRIRDFNGKNCFEKNDMTYLLGRTDVCRQKYCEFLISELVPYVDEHYNTINNDPTKRAHVGVSLGGVLSTYVGYNYPNYFNLIGSQSGAFWIDTPVYKNFKERENIPNLKCYLNAGTFEKNNYIHTQAFAGILKQKNYSIKEEYFNQGHSWGLWKETFGTMLKFLYQK